MFGACKASLVKGRCRQRRRRDSVWLYGGCLPGQAGRAPAACVAATSPPCGVACFGRLRRPRKAPLTGELAAPARPEGLLSGLASAPVTLFYACYTAQQPHRRKLPAVPTAGRGLRRRQWRESRWPPVRRGQWLRRVLLSGPWWGLPLPSVQLSALPWPAGPRWGPEKAITKTARRQVRPQWP